MRATKKDLKVLILITGNELQELQRHTYHMVEAFGLDVRVRNYKGKRPIGFHAWDLDCLFAVIELVLDDPNDYPDPSHPSYITLKNLLSRLKVMYAETFPRRRP